jgi:hypothetical protein
VYQTLTTTDELDKIWAKKLNVKPKVGYINEFDFNREELIRKKVTNSYPLPT